MGVHLATRTAAAFAVCVAVGCGASRSTPRSAAEAEPPPAEPARDTMADEARTLGIGSDALLPRARHTAPLRDAAIEVTVTPRVVRIGALYCAETPALEDTPLERIEPLFEALAARGEGLPPSERRATLRADERIRFAGIADVLFTFAHAGFVQIDYVVQDEGEPARLALDDAPVREPPDEQLVLRVLPDGYTLGMTSLAGDADDGARPPPEALDSLDAVGEALRSIRAREPDRRDLVLMPAPDVPYRAMIEAMDVALSEGFDRLSVAG